MEIFHACSQREGRYWATKELVWVVLEQGIDLAPQLFFVRCAATKGLILEQAPTPRHKLKPVTELVTKFAPELGGRGSFQNGRLHEGAIRQLVIVTAPILHPSRAPDAFAGIRNGHLRNQNRIVAKRCKDDLVDLIRTAPDLFAQIPDPEYSFKRFRDSPVIRAQKRSFVKKKPDSPAIAALRGKIVIEEFGRAFVLPALHIAIVRNNSQDPIIP